MDDRHATDAHRKFGFLLKDVSRLLSHDFERRCAEVGLTPSQCCVLGHLQRSQGISQARLAEFTDSDPMTLGRLLARMEASALVERRADPSDGRANSLYLGPKAGPLLDEVWHLSERTGVVALAGLDAADRGQLVALLQRNRDNLEVPVPEAAAAAGNQLAARPAPATAAVTYRAQRRAA